MVLNKLQTTPISRQIWNPFWVSLNDQVSSTINTQLLIHIHDIVSD